MDPRPENAASADIRYALVNWVNGAFDDAKETPVFPHFLNYIRLLTTLVFLLYIDYWHSQQKSPIFMVATADTLESSCGFAMEILAYRSHANLERDKLTGASNI